MTDPEGPAVPRPAPAALRSVSQLRAVVPYLNLLMFLGPALALAILEGQTVVGGVPALLGAGVAGVLGGRRFVALRAARLPAAVFAASIPVLLAPDGLLEGLLAAASGFGVLAWITTITDAPMGPGRRRAGLTVPLVGLLATLTIAWVAPGLSAGPGFAALLVVLAVLIAAAGLLGEAEPEPAEVLDFDDPVPAPTP